ncbi:hypothetical protein AURDEDRAFT_186932 [Auricularia subglabra TFB-10046 SS5]|nr:hypothetical protein AURDEDRAFT_186932 [Auricularia subglabra TFB-10046 SS5]
MTPIFDAEPTRGAIYEYIQSVLRNTADKEASPSRVSEVLCVIRSAVHDACADFAERWNNMRIGRAPERLPAEVLTMCFRAARFDVVRSASQVSRKWRAIALADRTLWTTFRRTEPRHHEERSTNRLVAHLELMLERSHPHPVYLELPKTERGFFRLVDRVTNALHGDFSRIQRFDGLFEIYKRLSSSNSPTPHLQFLRLSEPGRHLRPAFDLASGTAPELRQIELIGATLSIPQSATPLSALTRLQFQASQTGREYAALFELCPNLVALHMSGVNGTAALPRGPLPPTLQSVSLYAPDGEAVNFGGALGPWSGSPIQTLELYGSATLGQPLYLFTSTRVGPIEMEIKRNVVRITDAGASAQSARSFVVYPYTWRDRNQLHALRGPASARLSSLAVHIDHLDGFFDAYLNAPLLSTLEIHLDTVSSGSRVPERLPRSNYGLRAPSLRRMAVQLPAGTLRAAWDGENACSYTVRVLRDHLRDLIGYDAALLDAVTVRGPARLLKLLRCSELSPLAASYEEHETTDF